MCYTNNAVEMANLGRNEPNTTHNTPAPHQIGFDDFLSALMALKTEEPSASQATAGYQHGILNQFSVPEPTIDEAPVYPTPTNRRKSIPGCKDSITDFMKNSLKRKKKTTKNSDKLQDLSMRSGYSWRPRNWIPTARSIRWTKVFGTGYTRIRKYGTCTWTRISIAAYGLRMPVSTTTKPCRPPPSLRLQIATSYLINARR